MKKFDIGTLYKVRFHDHCCGGKDLITCESVGWVIKNDPKYVVLTSWRVDSPDKDTVENNVETTTILKSCIVRSRKYS